MRLIITEKFKKDFKKIPYNLRERTFEKLRILVKNPNHPSLRVKKVKRYKNIFEASITKDYRLLFQIESDGYILLRIGKHDIIKNN